MTKQECIKKLQHFNVPDSIFDVVISHEYESLEDFIQEFQKKVDWDYISACQKLSEDFIRKFQKKVDWACISSCQKLSEAFIREFRDKVRWNRIYSCQKLSKVFILEFRERILIDYVLENYSMK